MREEKMSAEDSTASAIRAVEVPTIPATSLTITSTAFVSSPACAQRMLLLVEFFTTGSLC
jgi:hypothetical protein